jgi:ElaB/YqjD/DUF883 family membrane-anchored ribosome-binding protein
MSTSNVTDTSRLHAHEHEKKMHDKSPEEIQLEIAHTKSAITEDLRVLSERFSPQHLREGAREVMRDAREEATKLIEDAKQATIGSLIGAKDRAVESVKESVSEKVQLIGSQARLLGNQVGSQAKLLGEQAKQASDLTVNFVSRNALTVSLLGFGAGWLLVALRNYRRASRNGGDVQDYYALPAGRMPRNERVSDTVRSAGDVVQHDTANGVRGMATAATHAADRARAEARGALDETRARTQQARGALRETARRGAAVATDNKVAVVALTVAAGLGLSLLFPVGRRPRRALVSAGERVWDGAQTTAHRLAERARQTV